MLWFQKNLIEKIWHIIKIEQKNLHGQQKQ